MKLLLRPWGHVRVQIARACAVAMLAFLASGCATLSPDPARVMTFAWPDAGQTTLGRSFAAVMAANTEQSGFQLLPTGHEALVARGALAELAERTLDLQYYSVGEDASSRLLLARLLAAAERGVRVRVLLDDLHPAARDFGAQAVAAHPGIQARLFNPFRALSSASLVKAGELLFDGKRLNARMHNKAWIADNIAAIFGSRNVGDEYFDLNEVDGFTDLDLLVVGPAVRAMSATFDSYWNSESSFDVERWLPRPAQIEGAAVRLALSQRQADCEASTPCRWLADTDLREALRGGRLPLIWAPSRFMADAPDGEKTAIASGIEHGFVGDDAAGTSTHGELLLVSPYFVPDAHGVAHLAQMRQRGVRVAVLTNSLASTDSVAAHAGYARRRMALLRAGVELFEFRPQAGQQHRQRHRWGHASPGSLHTKLVVQDRARVIVGSFNQDPRSRLHNTESWLAIESPILAAELAQLFDEGTEPHHAFRVERATASTDPEALVWITSRADDVARHDSEPMAALWLWLWRALLGVLIPEHLL